MKKLHHWAAAALAASLLAACGDSPIDDSSSPPLTEVPAIASSSPSAYTQFTGSLANTETGTPLGVNSVTPPTTETDAPLTI